MKYIAIILIVILFSCGNRGKRNEGKECYLNKIEEIDNFVIFRLDSIPVMHENLLTEQNKLIDSILVSELADCLGDKVKNYGNSFNYYSIYINKSADKLSFIRVDDYSYKQYLAKIDKLICKINYCVEASSSGGDGGDGFHSFSILTKDTLRKEEVIYSVMIDKITDMFIDSALVDTIRSVHVLNNNDVKLIKSDTIKTKISF